MSQVLYCYLSHQTIQTSFDLRVDFPLSVEQQSFLWPAFEDSKSLQRINVFNSSSDTNWDFFEARMKESNPPKTVSFVELGECDGRDCSSQFKGEDRYKKEVFYICINSFKNHELSDYDLCYLNEYKDHLERLVVDTYITPDFRLIEEIPKLESLLIYSRPKSYWAVPEDWVKIGAIDLKDIESQVSAIYETEASPAKEHVFKTIKTLALVVGYPPHITFSSLRSCE